jgi:NADH dehydrogenase
VILVTGGTGFVGPKIVHALRGAGKDVRALVRKPERGAALGVELVEGDVTDAASLRRAVKGCDAVVHLVAIILGKPADFERVMAQGTRDLVAAARDAGVRRFVLMSALGVGEKTKELTPYYRAKWDMEQAVQGSGLEHVIFRPSFVFGSDGGALQVFMRQVRWSPVTPVIGDGEKEIQPIWVDDVAAFFAKGVDLPAAASRTFELGGPDVVTWNELYARIAAALHKRRGRLNLPVGLARAGAAMVEWLPNAPITRDQIQMIEAGDNTCDMTPAHEVFGIETVPLDEMIRRAA